MKKPKAKPKNQPHKETGSFAAVVDSLWVEYCALAFNPLQALFPGTAKAFFESYPELADEGMDNFTVIIPEPSRALLAVLGLVALVARRRR